MKEICTVLFFLSIVSCKSTQSSTIDQNLGAYKALAQEKLGDNVEFIHSPSDEYVLCLKETKGTSKLPQNSLTYFVYSLKKSEVIYQDSFGPGTVEWFDGNSLEIFYLPGTMGKDMSKNDFTYIYNLETGDKTRKSNLDLE